MLTKGWTSVFAQSFDIRDRLIKSLLEISNLVITGSGVNYSVTPSATLNTPTVRREPKLRQSATRFTWHGIYFCDTSVMADGCRNQVGVLSSRTRRVSGGGFPRSRGHS